MMLNFLKANNNEEKLKQMEMQIERLDHLGIAGGIIKDLNLVEMIDTRVSGHVDEKISTGDVIAGMVISGRGHSFISAINSLQ